MIPLRDANPTRRTPWVTLGIIALNVVVFAFWQGFPVVGPESQSQVETVFCYGVIPAEVSDFSPLREVARACGGKSVLFSIFSSMFLHGSLLHIAGNMLFLWVFGNNIEDRMGRVAFTIFYLAAGVVAVFAQVLPSPGSQVPLIGASGAIAGTLGAYLVLYPNARVLTLVPIFFFLQVMQLPAIVVLGFWFVLQAISSFTSFGGAAAEGGVAYLAHVGGFAFGALVALIFYRGRGRPQTAYLEY
ncbi:MAG TPA: rhomboid family intramembrane serine protease [Actinomycetota bacterium]|jgi:membrane associated rhomboid family serine protease|nr:rhomboid family intramembrane serine protease [Actinomycetota bacterium]